MRFFMLEKDRLNILSIHEAVGKIFNYSKSYSNADDFYQNQRDFDAAMMNFKIQTSNGSIATKIQAFLRGIQLITNSILPPNEAFCPKFALRAHLSNYTGRTSRILAPFFILQRKL